MYACSGRDPNRDVAIAMHVERLGYRPGKLTGHKNGNFAFEREQLALLDEAIDRVIEEQTGKLIAPLFVRPAGG